MGDCGSAEMAFDSSCGKERRMLPSITSCSRNRVFTSELQSSLCVSVYLQDVPVSSSTLGRHSGCHVCLLLNCLEAMDAANKALPVYNSSAGKSLVT